MLIVQHKSKIYDELIYGGVLADTRNSISLLHLLQAGSIVNILCMYAL